MLFVGIDPGKKGGIAFIEDKGHEVMEWDDEQFIEIMFKNADNIALCTVEKVWGQHMDTPVTAFSLGHSLGYIEGVLQLLKIPYQLVPPLKWKGEYSLGSNKQQSIDCCKKLFPDVNLRRTERCRKDHDGMAEALLICEYGRRHYAGQ